MTTRAIAYASLLWLLGAAKVHAGPIEFFDAVSVDETARERLVAPYMWGGSGLFLSADAGKSFRMLCSSWIDPAAQRSNLSVLLQAGSIYVAGFDAVWRGDKDGCNFRALPEFAKHWVSALAADPLDPTRIYATLSDATPARNGVYLSTAGGTFRPLGSSAELFIDTLTVVKRNGGRRFYETGALNDPQTNETRYSVRVSDDDAETWTDYVVPLDRFGSTASTATFSIAAIDPQNPDRVVARIARDDNDMPDTVLYSAAQGMPNSWVVLAEVGAFDAAAFGADGTLYFGDDDQDSPGLFVVDHPGAAARKLNGDWKVRCLQYDSDRARLYACSDFRFGTADVTTGVFTPHIDMRCAERFVECPGVERSPSDVCADQLQNAYCGITHYSGAPLCDAYPKDSLAIEVAQDSGYSCHDGVALPTQPPASGAIASASAVPAADLEMPQAQAPDGASSTPIHAKAATCAVAPTGDSALGWPTAVLALSTLLLRVRRKRSAHS
jgi:MYXO-CTERM domain-containing protein